MATLIETRPQPFSFVGPILAASGAFLGLFVGTAQGAGLMGMVIGAAVMAALSWALMAMNLPRRPVRWGLAAVFAALGFVLGGLMGGLIDHPFRWSDDMNRSPLFFKLALFPGYFLARPVAEVFYWLAGEAEEV